jgi:hypothetical protein
MYYERGNMTKKVEIKIADVIGGGSAVATTDGQKVFDQIAAAFRSGNDTVLSFKGITALNTLFLNAAVGQLYGAFKEDEVRAHLSIVDMDKNDVEFLKRVVETAKEYFKDPKRFEQTQRELLGSDDA